MRENALTFRKTEINIRKARLQLRPSTEHGARRSGPMRRLFAPTNQLRGSVAMVGKNLPTTMYTLVQLRCSAMPQMAQFIPMIQERLRHQGYAGFREQIVSQARLAPATAVVAPARAQLETRSWHFTDRHARAEVIVQTDSIVYQSVHPWSYRDFLSNCIDAIAAVHEQARIGIVERIGLRCVDFLIPEQGYAVNDCLSIDLGSGAAPQGKRLRHYREDVSETRAGFLVSRMTHATGGADFPQDLLPVNLSIELPVPNGPFACLDNDHYGPRPFEFNVNEVVARLIGLHGPILDSIAGMTTQHARNERLEAEAYPLSSPSTPGADEARVATHRH